MTPAFSAYYDIDSPYYTVLVLAGIQFISSVGDHMVLCFGFVTKTMTNTLISAKAFSTFHAASSVSRVGGDVARAANPK